VALLLSRFGIGKFIPLYYGSSFSYLAALVAITNASFGQVAPDEKIRIAQAGIIATGLINIIVGLIIRAVGAQVVEMERRGSIIHAGGVNAVRRSEATGLVGSLRCGCGDGGSTPDPPGDAGPLQ